MADGFDLAGIGGFFPGIAAADPFLGDNLDIVVAERLLQNHRIAGDGVGLAAVAAFDDLAHKRGQELAAFPVQPREPDGLAVAGVLGRRRLREQRQPEQDQPYPKRAIERAHGRHRTILRRPMQGALAMPGPHAHLCAIHHRRRT